MPSGKALERLWDASEELKELGKQREKAFAAIEKAREQEAKATATLAAIEGSFMEARERVQAIIEKDFDGEDRFGLLDIGGRPPGAAIMRARQVMGEAGEDSGSRGRRSEIQPAVLDALQNAEEGLTSAAIVAAVSDRLERTVSAGSVAQAVQALLKKNEIRRTGSRRHYLYWPSSEAQVTIKPGEELDKEAQQRLAELRTELEPREDGDEDEE